MRKWSKSIALLTAASLALSGCGVEIASGEESNPAMGQAVEYDGQEQNHTEGIRQVILAGDEAELNIRAQDDFYGYVNAETLWNLSVPYGETTAGGFDQAAGEIDEQLKGIIRDVMQEKWVPSDGGKAGGYAPGSSEQLIKDYYELCKAGKYTDKKIFDQVFAQIDGIQTVEELIQVSGEIYNKYQVAGVYSLAAEADTIDPSTRKLCIGNMETFMHNLKSLYEDDDEVNRFRDRLVDMLMGLGADYEDASDRADKITYLWLDIAAETDFKALEKQDKEKLVNRYSMKDVSKFLPEGMEIDEFLKNYGLTEQQINAQQEIIVFLPEQLTMVKSLLTSQKLEIWKDYLRCAFCGVYDSYLPQEYTLEDRSEQELDEDSIMEMIEQDCYFYLSDLYYDRCYTDELASYMNHMMEDIKGAYIKMIRQADWLTWEGRELFVEKFENIHFFFGGQDWRDTDPKRKEIKGASLLEWTVQKNWYANQQTYASLLEPVDITEWNMGSQEVNAYYDPSVNSIYVTTGILHAPFFDLKADYSTNLGGIGVVICHELSHGFDNSGIQYDKDGRYMPEWVPAADREAFAKIVERVDEYYDQFALLDVYHVNGENTVGENLADLGAMQCILSLAGTTKQKKHIFENYARIWCTLYQKDDLITYLTKDVHSPDPVRVNAVVSCMDDFYEVYHVTENDGMYLVPEGRVNRW